MIFKIEPPSSKITNTVCYNENKANGEEGIRKDNELAKAETGHVVVTRNVPEGITMEEEFSRLKLKNMFASGPGRKMENTAFHMSVNPGEEDPFLNEQTIVEIIDQMMKHLGYGDVPYRIYRHNDIERQHYHVVSTRIGQNGKKINDSFENTRAYKHALSLAEKYGFTVGKPDDMEENIEEDKKKTETAPLAVPSPAGTKKETKNKKDDKKKKFVKPFDIRSETPVTEQYAEIHSAAMEWSFTTIEQYEALLRIRYNVCVKDYDDGFNYAGMEKSRKIVTPLIKESDIPVNATDDLIKKLTPPDGMSLDAMMKRKVSQRKHLEENVKAVSLSAADWTDFRQQLAKRGIIPVISWNKNGEAFGVTWIDRVTKCIWKGSQTEINMKWLKELEASKGWKITIHPYYETNMRSQSITSATAPATQQKTSRFQRTMDGFAALRGIGNSVIATYDAMKHKKRDEDDDEEQEQTLSL